MPYCLKKKKKKIAVDKYPRTNTVKILHKRFFSHSSFFETFVDFVDFTHS